MGLKARMILYTGPMFSGKSDRLLKNLEELEDLTGTRALVYKPLTDTRSGFEVRSRTGKSRPAYTLDEPSMLRNLVALQAEMSVGKTLILAFDEVQFFEWQIVDEIISIHREHPRVIILAAGLNMDYKGHPMIATRTLMCSATQVVVCAAKCRKCTREATMTYRKPGLSKKTMVVGDDDIYEPRCPPCWQRGLKEEEAQSEQALCAD